jgi:hypothetical protein
MRTPVVKRHTTPKSGFFAFFRRSSDAVLLWHRVLTACPQRGADRTGLPQTLLEVRAPGARRWQGVPSAFAAPSQPLGALVPSSANDRLTGPRAPVRGRRGCGAAPVHRRPLALSGEEQAELSHQPPGAGRGPETRRGVQRRRESGLGARRGAGASPRGPVRRPAPLRRSLSGGFVLPDAPGGRRRPLVRQPTGEAPGRWGCRRLPSVSRPRPWRTGRGGTRRRQPVPEGRGRAAGGRRAARGGGACRCRAPWAAETGEGRHGAGRL